MKLKEIEQSVRQQAIQYLREKYKENFIIHDVEFKKTFFNAYIQEIWFSPEQNPTISGSIRLDKKHNFISDTYIEGLVNYQCEKFWQALFEKMRLEPIHVEAWILAYDKFIYEHFSNIDKLEINEIYEKLKHKDFRHEIWTYICINDELDIDREVQFIDGLVNELLTMGFKGFDLSFIYVTPEFLEILQKKRVEAPHIETDIYLSSYWNNKYILGKTLAFVVDGEKSVDYTGDFHEEIRYFFNSFNEEMSL